MLITFEGIDGSGKSTQINFLAEYLKSLNFEVITLREPGGTAFSEAIRELLLNSDFRINSVTELFLFEAARSELVENVILPALQKNKIVISDRFYDSTTAYQGYGRELDLEKVQIINAFAARNLVPDITFFLNLDHDSAQKRANDKTPDNIENSGIDFFHKVHDGFRKIAERDFSRVVVINADGTVEETKILILNEFKKRFKEFLSQNENNI